MQQQERHGARAPARDMQEMQVDTVQRHLVLWEGVETRFLGTPVEAVTPIVDQPRR